MKKFFAAVAIAILAFTAQAQFLGGNTVVQSAITNSGTWAIIPAAGGGAATNMSLAQAPWITVGSAGFGVAIKSYATNAALTTNTWFTLEFNVDGSNAITNNNVTVVLLPRGTATNVYFTNFVMSSSATIGDIYQVRIKDVMQTNGLIGSSLAGHLFVEKFSVISR